MREIGAVFVFKSNTDNLIPNQTLFELRREIARIMRDCEFGDIVEITPETFSNTFAHPNIDQFFPVENELHISYHWIFPLQHGNLMRIIYEEVPELHNFANRLGLVLTFRTVII